MVGNGRSCAVELSERDGELLVVRLRLVLKDAKCGCLPQQQRRVGVAAVMDAGVDAMTEADVVPKLIQLTIHRERWTQVGQQREPIVGGHHRVGDHEIPVEEKL